MPKQVTGTPREVFDRMQSEDDFTRTVLDLAGLMGFSLCYHPYNSQKSTEGWPDWALLRPGRVGEQGRLVLAELKSETGKVSANQQAWITALQTVPGITAGIYRPSSWPELERVLRGGRA